MHAGFGLTTGYPQKMAFCVKHSAIRPQNLEQTKRQIYEGQSLDLQNVVNSRYGPRGQSGGSSVQLWELRISLNLPESHRIALVGRTYLEDSMSPLYLPTLSRLYWHE
jgi:hypothetical protein